MAEASLAPQLTVISDALKGVFTDGDRSFLAVGDQLAEAIGVFARLTARFDELQETLADPRLREAALQLENVGGDLASLCAALDEEGKVLAHLQDLNRRVRRRLTVIRRTTGAITMLSINAAIAASGVDLQSEDFASFTRRFKHLADRASRAIADSARRCEQLGRVLDVAHERHQDFAKGHNQVLALVARQLQACVHALDEQRARAADASRTIGARSQQISSDIGVVVMALQISDITRQRLEHVAEALALLAQGIDDDLAAPDAAKPKPNPGHEAGQDTGHEAGSAADGRPWSHGLDPEQRIAVANHVCQLQEAQMAHAMQEFDQEVGRVAASLRKLVSEAEELVALGGRGYGSNQGMGSFLDSLEAEVSRTVALVREYQSRRVEVDADMAAAAATMRELLDELAAVDVIEADMRLVSWNTALLCQRIGVEGRVLGAVSQELSTRAARLRGDIGGLLAVVEDIAREAGRFEEDRESAAGERMARMEQAIEASLQPLRQGGADLTAALGQLRPDGSAVGLMLRESATALAGCDDIARTMRAMHGRLANLIDDDPERAPDPGLIAGWMRSFQGPRYSMESERAIHARIGGARGAEAAPAAAPAGAAEESIDDLLF